MRPYLLYLMFLNVAVVVIPNCPKKSHYFQKGGRFAFGVVIISCLQKDGRFAALVVVVPNGCPIPEGGRSAALVVVPNCPKETHYFAFKKAAASRP